MLELLTRPAAIALLALSVLAACNDTEAVDTDNDGDADVVVEGD